MIEFLDAERERDVNVLDAMLEAEPTVSQLLSEQSATRTPAMPVVAAGDVAAEVGPILVEAYIAGARFMRRPAGYDDQRAWALALINHAAAHASQAAADFALSSAGTPGTWVQVGAGSATAYRKTTPKTVNGASFIRRKHRSRTLGAARLFRPCQVAFRVLNFSESVLGLRGRCQLEQNLRFA